MIITVEELYKATEKDVGKLCYFYDTGYEVYLPHIEDSNDGYITYLTNRK